MGRRHPRRPSGPPEHPGGSKRDKQTTRDPHARAIDKEQTQALHEAGNSTSVSSCSANIVYGSGDCSREHMSSGCAQSSLYSMQGRQGDGR